MRKQRIPIMTASAFGFIAICIVVIGAWDIFTEARSKTPAPQEQMSPAELSAAIEAQREASARLTRSGTFDQKLQKLRERAQKKGTVPVIVKVRAAFRPEGYISSAAERLAQRKVIEEAQDQLLAGLRYEPSSLKRYADVPYVAVSTDSYGLAQLQSSADVMDVFEDKSMRLATAESLPQIKATRAWAGGYTGVGKTVAILDSGVDKTHPDLSNKVVAEACFSTNDPAAGYESLCPGAASTSTEVDSGKNCTVLGGLAGCDHGTHIAGIAAGRSGVAIDANIISIQVMSYVTNNPEECGVGNCLRSRTSDVMDALKHVYDNLRNSYEIAAVNISQVSDITSLYASPCDEGDGAPLKAKIDQLKSVGIATIVAAGNDGFTDALNYPACISTAVSVGAVGDGSGSVPADMVWQNSNSASFLSLLAPGVEITSAIPGGGQATGLGTSQAAAHVSGAWALLKQKESAISMDDALNRFKTTGVIVTDARNGAQFRRIQLDTALDVNVPEDRWLGAYYNNPNLADNPVLIQNDGDGFIDRYYPPGASPAPGIGAENYSIRWTRTVTFTQGTHRFSVTGDDGVRLYIDGQLKINEWRNQAATSYNADVILTAGNHKIKLEYYQSTGPAQARLIWGILNPPCSQTPPIDHWKGEYFNNANLAGSPVMMRDVGSNDSLNFNWGVGAPSSDCNLTIFPDYFSVKWTRTVNLGAATYRFTVFGDNGVRLWVDNQKVIDRWTETVGTNTANVQLLAGNHEIRLEYFETSGAAAVSVSWTPSPGPPSNLVASAVSVSQINLSWTDNSSIEDGFKIERWNGNNYSQINSMGANVTTYTDSWLAPSTTYYYRVRAYNSVGDSGYSNESSATTLPCTYSVSPTSATFGEYGGDEWVTVSAPAGCSWSAVSSVWWITIISGASGAGNGSVNYKVEGYFEPNSHREGTLWIAGRTVTIDQSGHYGNPPPCCFVEPYCICDPLQLTASDPSVTDVGPRGLTARYFSNTTLSDQLALQRIDPTVSFTWAGRRPDKLLPADRFSVRWSGQLAAPSSEAYTFYLYSDDGARLWVNNRLVIDRWQATFEPHTRSAPVELKAGEKADIRVEYYDAGGDALIHLLWGSASTPAQIIPQRHLYPEAATNKSTPADTNQQTEMLRRYMFSKPVRITSLSMTLTAALFIIGGVIVSATAVGGRLWKGKAGGTVAPVQKAQFMQTVRVWVHGDRVSPDLIYARPGRILLQAENQTGSDISLKFDRWVAGGTSEAHGLVRTARQGKRSGLEVTLGAGEYVFYDEARPEIKGRLIVDPQLDKK